MAFQRSCLSPWLCLFTLLFLLTSLPSPAGARPVHYRVRVVATYPHDPDAFTQGLLFYGGYLYESTGRYGKSSIRQCDLTTGSVRRQADLLPVLFGEGIALYGHSLIQLTWKNGLLLRYDLSTFQITGRFRLNGEGWGLAFDGRHLILSDGTATLRLLDPETLQETGKIRVQERNRPVVGLNELEFINGQLFANLYPSSRVAVIDLDTGEVTGWFDLSALVPPVHDGDDAGVPNGIAWDAAKNRLLVTGKRWPHVYEIILE